MSKFDETFKSTPILTLNSINIFNTTNTYFTSLSRLGFVFKTQQLFFKVWDRMGYTEPYRKSGTFLIIFSFLNICEHI